MVRVKELVILGFVFLGVQGGLIAGFGAYARRMWQSVIRASARKAFGMAFAFSAACGNVERGVDSAENLMGGGECLSRDRNGDGVCNKHVEGDDNRSKDDLLNLWSDKRLDPTELWVPVFFLSPTEDTGKNYWEQMNVQECIVRALIRDPDTIFIGKRSRDKDSGYMREYRQCRSACSQQVPTVAECFTRCNQELNAHANVDKNQEVTPKMRELFKHSHCDVVERRDMALLGDFINNNDKVAVHDMLIIDLEHCGESGCHGANTYVHRNVIVALEKRFSGKFQCTRRVKSHHDFCVVGHIPGDPSQK